MKDLHEHLAKHGKVLTANERQKIAEMQRAAAADVLAEYELTKPSEHKNTELSALDSVLIRIPKIANIIGDIGDTLTVLTQALIPSLLPFLLIALIYAEAERVRYGVLLFEVHGKLAAIVAVILVIGNAFVELTIQHQHSVHNYTRSSGYKFSFRVLWQRARYWLGIGKDWQPQAKSPALRWERLQLWLTSAILFLAIAGSMTDAIRSTSGNWRQGLKTIVVDSTLLELMTWVSGLVAAVVIVLLAQGIVAYAYVRGSEFYHELVTRKAAADAQANPDYEQWERSRAVAIEAAKEQIERDMLIAIAARRDIPLEDETVNPLEPELVISLNGNGMKHQA